jgi:hypothetical protein
MRLLLDRDLQAAIDELARRDDRPVDATVRRLLRYALAHIEWPAALDGDAATAKSVMEYVVRLKRTEQRAGPTIAEGLCYGATALYWGGTVSYPFSGIVKPLQYGSDPDGIIGRMLTVKDGMVSPVED